MELAYGAGKQRARAERRELANERAKTRVDPGAFPDPLHERAASLTRVLGRVLLCVAASAVLHVALTLVVSLVKTEGPRRLHPYEQAVQVRITEPPKPAAPAPETPPDQPVIPPPRPVIKAPAKVLKEDVPPPDPINPPAETPPPEPPKEQPRRIVGIDMESTTVGGDGPALAVGNTRMGETALVARDPNAALPLSPELVLPKRTSAPTPDYPSLLKSKQIEGDVGVKVDVDASGHVSNVTVVEPSEHDEFNRAATDAAMRSTYEPAKLNGVPVAHAIEFTVRFRLHK
jgi:protein TonB